jgi:circadian clock protein KaiC
MSEADDDDPETLRRLQTGLHGLDAITHGGFFGGGVYMLLARPGSGKTILGNHICYRHVAAGGRALYVTLLAESHARMISAIKSMAFYDASSVGTTLTYLSGYEALERDKLKGLLDLLRKSIRDHKATLLVLDGLVTVGSVADSEIETKKFIHELQVFVELVGCTTLLLTGANPDEQYALRTMVDGLLELRVDAIGMEVARTIEVVKFRGGPVLLGRHLFAISDAGISIHPRTESRPGTVVAERDPTPALPVPFRIQGLDAMLGGGLLTDSTTMVLGAPGSGKTLLGLSFLAAGASAKEPGLYFGFFEAPAILCRRAENIGIDLASHVRSGLLDIMWQSPRAATADAIAEKLLAAVRERKVRRLFIDGLDGFKDSLVYPGRTRPFFGALCDELRALGVVVLVSDQTESLGGIEFPERGLTSMLDNVISLRHVESRGRLRKLISVVKMREGKGDPALHEFSIGPRGFTVSPAEGDGATTAIPATGTTAPPRRSSAKKVAKRRGR